MAGIMAGPRAVSAIEARAGTPQRPSSGIFSLPRELVQAVSEWLSRMNMDFLRCARAAQVKCGKPERREKPFANRSLALNLEEDEIARGPSPPLVL
jgi:hypothetical protein